jgi:PAS domain S-box-containing protein
VPAIRAPNATPTTPTPRPFSGPTPGAVAEAPARGEAVVSRPPDPDPQGESETPPVAARPTAPAILVVDDNAMNRDMLSRRLERKGYRVGVAESGEIALRALSAQPFDAVLLDWMMPGMSGIEVLKEIRARWSAIELPVIMATAKSEAEDVLEALRADANDYVTKPLNFEVVHARLRTHLNLVEAHRELRASERRFRALLENTGDMIVQFRPSGEVTYVSPAVRTLLGLEPDAFSARSFHDWLHPIDRRALEDRQAQRGGAMPPSYTFIARMTRHDQGYIWVETSCRVLEDEAGGPLVQAACRDVTEHMERLAGDEPPLPLGGDILTQPTWRHAGLPAPSVGASGASPSTAPAATPGSPPDRPASAILAPASAILAPAPPIVVVLGDVSGAPDELGRRVAEAITRARLGDAAPPRARGER